MSAIDPRALAAAAGLESGSTGRQARARAILSDPRSTAWERQWAEDVLDPVGARMRARVRVWGKLLEVTRG